MINENLKAPAPAPKVLVIDDEPQLRELIGELISDNITPILAADASEGLKLAKQEQPALILLDIMMPGIDGIRTCQILRDDPETSHIPIIMLTAANDPLNRIRSFKMGADDFIAKPFSFDELMARIFSKLRRSSEKKSKSAQTLRCENLTLSIDKYQAQINGNLLKLSALEFELLQLLVQNENRIVTRKLILEKVWGKKEVPPRVIDTHIVSLRKNLKDFNGSLRTIYSKGYILRTGDWDLKSV